MKDPCSAPVPGKAAQLVQHVKRMYADNGFLRDPKSQWVQALYDFDCEYETRFQALFAAKAASVAAAPAMTTAQQAAFVQTHTFHSLFDKDLKASDIVRHGYRPATLQPPRSLLPSLSDRKRLERRVEALARVRTITQRFEPGGCENALCEDLVVVQSHREFFEDVLKQDRVAKWYIYIPSMLTRDAAHAAIYFRYWLPHMYEIRHHIAKKIELGPTQYDKLVALYEYKHYAYNDDTRDPANLLSEQIFICNPYSQTTLVTKLSSAHFNAVFLRKMLTRDGGTCCPITLTPIRELTNPCYCFNCYTVYDHSKISLCGSCPICRKEFVIAVPD